MVWFDLINEQDPYDIVPDNSPQAHYRFMEKEIEILKVTSRVRDDIVRQERYKTADYLLRVLRAVLSEQRHIGLLHEDTESYIWEAVRDQAVRKGYID
jgi:hypothetical protein